MMYVMNVMYVVYVECWPPYNARSVADSSVRCSRGYVDKRMTAAYLFGRESRVYPAELGSNSNGVRRFNL